MSTYPGPLWRQVKSPRNTHCSTAKLDDLEWSDWWEDRSLGECYLRVAHYCDGTRHRVFCKLSNNPRLAQSDGKLFWLVERADTTKGATDGR